MPSGESTSRDGGPQGRGALGSLAGGVPICSCPLPLLGKLRLCGERGHHGRGEGTLQNLAHVGSTPHTLHGGTQGHRREDHHSPNTTPLYLAGHRALCGAVDTAQGDPRHPGGCSMPRWAGDTCGWACHRSRCRKARRELWVGTAGSCGRGGQRLHARLAWNQAGTVSGAFPSLTGFLQRPVGS